MESSSQCVFRDLKLSIFGEKPKSWTNQKDCVLMMTAELVYQEVVIFLFLSVLATLQKIPLQYLAYSFICHAEGATSAFLSKEQPDFLSGCLRICIFL